MTVKEMKQWLNKFPDDTIVEVGVQESPIGYDSYGEVKFVEFEGKYEGYLSVGFDYFDFKNDEYIKPGSKYEGKRVLRLGEKY